MMIIIIIFFLVIRGVILKVNNKTIYYKIVRFHQKSARKPPQVGGCQILQNAKLDEIQF